MGITINMISSFLPFMHQIRDIENYYTSYYWAVSAVEQWLLATKSRSSGFRSTGSWNYDNFWNFKKTEWKVVSRTNKIGDESTSYLYWWENHKKSKLDYTNVATISFKLDNNKAFSNATETSTSEPQEVNTKYAIPSISQSGKEIPASLKELIEKYMEGILSTEDITVLSWFNIVRQNDTLYLWIDHNFKFTDGSRIPLLEYSLDFVWDEVWDTKFNIIGKAQTKDYTTEIAIKKPTKEFFNPDFRKSLFPTKPTPHP